MKVASPMTAIDREVTQRVKEERERLGFTKTEIAEKLGMSKQSYQVYEAFGRPFAVAQVERLARLFGRTMFYMLGLKSQLTPSEDSLLSHYRAITDPRLRDLALRQVAIYAEASAP